mmetsp:Transcript_89167/g.195400  ORF Transcript_89167/g.195400 Transcript_89167/m.195400 type:complete len:443 (+) Transcript_89167:427-1755(+)
MPEDLQPTKSAGGSGADARAEAAAAAAEQDESMRTMLAAVAAPSGGLINSFSDLPSHPSAAVATVGEAEADASEGGSAPVPARTLGEEPAGIEQSAEGETATAVAAMLRPDSLSSDDEDDDSSDEGEESREEARRDRLARQQADGPTARAAPRGIRGLLGAGPGAYEPLDVDSLPQNTVLAHIYDVGDEDFVKKVNRIGTVNDKVLIGGVFHAGIEVYGREWSFGFTEEGSGVCYTQPRKHPHHRYKATVVMGPTKLSVTEVDSLILRLAQIWLGPTYDMIHRNCCDFANELSVELGVGRMPGWVDRLGRTASSVNKFTTRTAVRIDQTKKLVRSVTQDVGEAWSRSDIPLAISEIRKEVEEVSKWTLGTGREALQEGFKSWSSTLLGGLKSLTNETSKGKAPAKRGTAPPGENDLKNALRNRGGIARPNKPPPPPTPQEGS